VTAPPRPVRRLDAFDGAALIIATVIGAGIFTVPGLVASLTGSTTGFVGVWVLGGALALAGALTYAELASRYPAAGGEYVYLREAFGGLAAFLSGWTSFLAGFSGAIAASAVAVGVYAGRVFPAFTNAPSVMFHLGPLPISVAPATLVALGVIVLFTIIAVRGIGAARVVTNLLAITLVLGIVAFVGAGSTATAATVAQRSVGQGWAGMAAALVPVMFTYSGWNAATYVANDFDEPARNVPRALWLGTIAVTVLYVALNVTYVRILSLGGLALSDGAAGDAAVAALFGGAGRLWLASLVMAALLSSVCAMIVTGPRIYLQMARDGALPRSFARVRARDGVPVGSILAQSAWSCVLVVTGTFEAIVTYTGVAIVLFSGAAVATIFVFRRRDVVPAPGYRLPGFPVVPAAFVAITILMLCATVQRQPRPALAGLVFIALGVPVYFWGNRQRVVR